MSIDIELVPNRNCGECTACCVTLRIDEPSLKKHADTPCSNLSAKGDCEIYNDRPPTCRGYYCGWRHLDILGDKWRPDRSKIMLRLHQDGGIILQALESPIKVLTDQLAIEFIGGCIENTIPVFISVPAKPGFCYALINLNENLAPAIKSLDFQAAQNVITQAIEYGTQLQTKVIEKF